MNTATLPTSSIVHSAPEAEPILVIRSHQSLKNHTLNILKVWVKRFVENGDKVNIRLQNEDVIFECPDYLTELHVMMLCDIISEFGFAKAIFRDREY